MERYRLISPHPLLAPYVYYYWVLERSEASVWCERVIPFGHMQLCFYRGDVCCGGREPDGTGLMSGQSLNYTDVTVRGDTRIVAAVFTPYGARAFFGVPMRLLSGLLLGSDDLSDAGLRELERRVADADDPEVCVAAMDRFFLRRLSPPTAVDLGRLRAALAVTDRLRGLAGPADLASAACLSQKQFGRLFGEYVGLMPKAFLRMVRFQHFLALGAGRRDADLSDLGYACGYYDASHLAHEFRSFTGYAPGDYFSKFDPASDFFGSPR